MSQTVNEHKLALLALILYLSATYHIITQPSYQLHTCCWSSCFGEHLSGGTLEGTMHYAMLAVYCHPSLTAHCHAYPVSSEVGTSKVAAPYNISSSLIMQSEGNLHWWVELRWIPWRRLQQYSFLIYRHGLNEWYPSVKERKPQNCHWNNWQLTKVKD